MKEMIEQDALPQVADEQAGVELNGQGQVRRWKTYAEYKDSGVEWLGDIPAHWEVRRLKRLSKSMVAGPFGSSLTKDIYTKEGFKVYGQEQVISNDFSIGNYYVSKELYTQMKRYAVCAGNILISCVGTFGKFAVVPVDAQPGIINPRLIKFVVDKTIAVPEYLELLLRSQIVFEQIEKISRGGTMGVINLNLLDQVIVPIPSIDEQLSLLASVKQETIKINTLIAKKEQHVALLQERRTAIINQAVTKGLNANVAMKDSGVEWLGEIPEHWDIRKLKYDAKFFSGGTPSKANANYWSGEIPWVSPKDMKAEIILDTEDHISEEALRESATHLITEEAVLIVVRSGILKHSIPIAINQVPVTINQDIKAIKLNKKILPKYLAALFNSHQQVLLVEWRKAGATVESIEYDLLISTRICIPPIEEQHSIVAYLEQETNKIDRLITGIQESIKKLKEYSTALISAAVTGKIDVRGEVADGGAEDVTV